MKEKVHLEITEIFYIRNLIANDVKIIESNLIARQKLLQKFSEKSGK